MGLTTAASAAPMSSDDVPKPHNESALSAGSSKSNSSMGGSNKDSDTSTGDKSMDLLLNSKLPTAPMELSADQSAKGLGDPMTGRATPAGSNANAARSSQGGDGSGDGVKRWLKETGAASGEPNASAREAREGSDQKGRTAANRSPGQGAQAAESEPSVFGKAILFIRENRSAMLMLCALVLILAGAALMYSGKGSAGGRRFD